MDVPQLTEDEMAEIKKDVSKMIQTISRLHINIHREMVPYVESTVRLVTLLTVLVPCLSLKAY